MFDAMTTKGSSKTGADTHTARRALFQPVYDAIMHRNYAKVVELCASRTLSNDLLSKVCAHIVFSLIPLIGPDSGNRLQHYHLHIVVG